jgi:hypothetical protein
MILFSKSGNFAAPPIHKSMDVTGPDQLVTSSAVLVSSCLFPNCERDPSTFEEADVVFNRHITACPTNVSFLSDEEVATTDFQLCFDNQRVFSALWQLLEVWKLFVAPILVMWIA